MRRLSSAILLLLAMLAPGCRRERATGLSDSTFVTTMTQLRRIERDTSLDDSARSAARRAVLRHAGVTAEQLEQAAGALADDPEHALALWGDIDRRLRPPAPRRAPRE